MEHGFAQPVRYPNAYVWLLFASAMDIMLTWVILHFGGFEANPLADRVLMRWGLPGLVAYKFCLMTIVIIICEIVGRRNERTGRRLAYWAIGLTWIPSVVALVLLVVHT